jgi:hypothetical protein
MLAPKTFNRMREVSQLLSIGGTPEEMKELYGRLWYEFETESPIGRELVARAGPKILDRALQVFSERHPNADPSEFDFFSALEDIGRDLLRLEVSEPVQPVVAPPQVKKEPTADEKAKVEEAKKKQQGRDGEARRFAFMVQSQMDRDGYESLKSRAGYVTVTTIAENGKPYQYRYPYKQFESLWADATRLGLLTVGGLK